MSYIRIDALKDYQGFDDPGRAMILLPALPSPIQSSEHFDHLLDWELAWERCARKEREDQCRSLMCMYERRTGQLIAQRDEARAALRQVWNMFQADFYIGKLGGITNADQDRIDAVFAAVKAALEETDANEG